MIWFLLWLPLYFFIGVAFAKLASLVVDKDKDWEIIFLCVLFWPAIIICLPVFMMIILACKIFKL